MKPLRIRPRADRDIDEAFAFIARDNRDAAIRFLDAVEESFLAIRRYPGSGARRYAHKTLLQGVRFLPVAGFRNYLIFYLDLSRAVEIARILHSARDIPAVLDENT